MDGIDWSRRPSHEDLYRVCVDNPEVEEEMSNYYACPKCGPCDPVRTAERMIYTSKGFIPEYKLVCPTCGEPVVVKSDDQ